MKKVYTSPDLELVRFSLHDVILASETLGNQDIHDGTSSSSEIEFDSLS